MVFEGAIRKWVASAATLPLILLRDLLALYMVLYAWRGGHLRRYQKVTTVLLAWTLLVVGWGLMQMVGGESTPTIFLIGLRFWLLYIWFAVAAAATMTETDYRAAVRMAVVVMIVLAPLAVLQHYSSPGATINRQLDGDEESVFVAIAGVVRTTGTFSFTSGYATYLILVAPLVFALVAARKFTIAQRLFALAGFGAFIVGSVVSGSRAAVVSAGVMLGAYLIARLVFSRTRDKPAALGAVVVATVLVGGFLFFFSDAIQVTQQRFEQASSDENFWDRLLSTFIGEPHVLSQVTWLGQGLGAGSNLASSLYRGGANFGLAESETGRIVLEGGLLGFAFVALKLAVLLIGLVYALRMAIVRNASFPMVLWITMVVGIMTWPAIGQLSANGLLGLLLGYFLLLFRYPSSDLFPARSSSS
ncbi:O-antigen ligase family protein [Variovorax sp. LT1P1]